MFNRVKGDIVSLLVLLKNRAAGQPIIADDDDNEFLNIINCLAGSSIDKSVRIRSNDNSFAVARLDQLGTNDILELFLNGTEVAKFDNNGSLTINHGANPFVLINNTDGGTGLKFEVVDADTANIVSEGIGNIATINLTTRELTFTVVPTNVVKHKHSWFIPNPFDTNPIFTIDIGDFARTFLFPAGTGMRATKLSIIRAAGSHAGGSTLTARLQKNGGNIGSGIAFSDANNAANTQYSEALNVSMADGDRINLTLNQASGPAQEQDITAIMEWEQKLT